MMILVFVVLVALAIRFGTDSRDGDDWRPRPPRP
jgi:hypothetical protein